MKGVLPPRIDLRSDTVTRPTPAMREAMARAEVGDDVLAEDPTVNRLEEQLADLLGKQAAVFVPSGTMGNQIALRVHCRPGDEFICEENCHIHRYEQGAYASLSGLAIQTLPGVAGVLHPDQLRGTVREDNSHFPVSRLVCLENTHNRGGGKVQPVEDVETICSWAKQHGLARHLDGARLFNAVVATGLPPTAWTEHFDTVSVCFSKGLGAPVGSALCGTQEAIRMARRHRKAFGGGWRQAGILAAAALYALEHHVERLAEDHANAQILADAIRQTDGLSLVHDTVDTNIVIFEVAENLGNAEAFAERLGERGVAMYDIGPQRLRAVTHLDVSAELCREAAELLRQIAAGSTAIV